MYICVNHCYDSIYMYKRMCNNMDVSGNGVCCIYTPEIATSWGLNPLTYW